MAGKRMKALKTTGTWKRKQRIKDWQINSINHIRDWAGLPDYLLELVIERLPLVDCLSLSRVCKGWKSVTRLFFDGCSRGVPFLVKPGQSENISRNFLSILENNPSLEIQLPEARGRHVWGSYQDWLFLAEPAKGYVCISVLNPFSGENFMLPKIWDSDYMMVVSAVPSDKKCIYMVLGIGRVAFWIYGATEWREFFSLRYTHDTMDALYHEGSFYLFKTDYEMAVIDGKSVINMLSSDNSGDFSRIVIKNFPLQSPNVELGQGARRYIVESCGDILLVCRFFNNVGPRYYQTCGFETYKMDLSQMSWVKLENLGDRILFVGKSCSRSFLASDLGDALANHVYFSNNSFTNRTNEWDLIFKHGYFDSDDVDDWGVYSFDKADNDKWPHAFRKKAKHRAGVWLTCPLWWCLKHRNN